MFVTPAVSGPRPRVSTPNFGPFIISTAAPAAPLFETVRLRWALPWLCFSVYTALSFVRDSWPQTRAPLPFAPRSRCALWGWLSRGEPSFDDIGEAAERERERRGLSTDVPAARLALVPRPLPPSPIHFLQSARAATRRARLHVSSLVELEFGDTPFLNTPLVSTLDSWTLLLFLRR